MKITDIRRLEGAAMFGAFMAAVSWVTATESISTPFEIPRTMLLVVLFLTIRSLFMKHIASPTGSGAIVMAVGIFINGAIVQFAVFDTSMTRSLAIILFILLVFISASFIVDAVHRKTFRAHFANPIDGFAVGTWIAGVSVCSTALSQQLPAWKPFVQILVLGNIGLWIFFAYRTILNFFQLFKSELGKKVHGILLLSTVSTQSLVIAWRAAFGESPGYRMISPWMISIGVVFYCISFYLIIRRYIGEGTKIDLDKCWFNTNCIWHGAMSITGLASAVSGVVPPNLILLIWLWVLTWFIFVESAEIARAVKRTQRYGFADALLVYHPTQWSRNFTFGMLYAFTMRFDLSKSAGANSFLIPIRDAILNHFAWVILLLLIIQIFVFFRDRLSYGVASGPLASALSRFHEKYFKED